MHSGMIESSTSETSYLTSDFEPFLDLDIEPTLCKSSDFVIAFPIIIGPRRDKTCLHGFRLSEIQTSLLGYRV